MKANNSKPRPQELDFEIDKLTNSIQNSVSGDSFDTTVSPFTAAEQKLLRIGEWVFDWKKEIKDKTKSVYKLTIASNPSIIQGLISIEDRGDHIFMHLIESAKFNRGKSKIYLGVPANLVAFACNFSRQRGYDGVVSFFSKSKLINHYKETLGAQVLFGNQMIVNEKAAHKLISNYFK